MFTYLEISRLGLTPHSQVAKGPDSGRVLGTAGWSHSSCGTELAGNSVHTSGIQVVVLSSGLSEYHPKLRPCGYVPDTGCCVLTLQEISGKKMEFRNFSTCIFF